MTTATATPEGQTPPVEGRDELDTRTPTESILTENDGDAAEDSADVEAAMAAGFQRVNSTARTTDATPKGDDTGEQDITDVVVKKITPQEDDDLSAGDGTGQAGDDTQAQPQPQPDADPEVPGLGMKASEVRAKFAEMETLRKSVATTSGHLGHLKQLVEQAGKGKEVSAEAFTRVREEFGDEFANAFAEDLKAAGFGAGASVDPATIERMVHEQVAAVREQQERDFNKKLVLRDHKDANDYFAHQKIGEDGKPLFQDDGKGNSIPVMEQGPKYGVLAAFVETLPADRKKELETNGWDADVISRLLSDVKEHEKKAANQQAMQTQRTARAVAPTGSSGRSVTPPTVDPIEAGWQSVRGKRGAAAPSAARR
jgi:hypothetical protein